MALVTLIIVLAAIVKLLKLPVFETVFGLLLITPVLGYLVGHFIGLSSPVYYGLIIVSLTTFWFCLKPLRMQHKEILISYDLIVLVLFCVAFFTFYSLCLLWPDFIAIAERHRDYAVLSSVIASPVYPGEPWLAGYDLNYYVYWYRFGHMLSTMLGLEIWEVYHQLQSFTFAFFLSGVFLLFRSLAGFSVFSSLTLSLVVVLGSNLAGLLSFIGRTASHIKDYTPAVLDAAVHFAIAHGLRADGGAGWWGPSRVIEGAINEFPAWSFLLGDAHPHYLNLGLIPFFILLAARITPSGMHYIKQTVILGGFFILPSLWLYNSNTWEVPIWLGMCAIYFSLILASKLSTRTPTILNSGEVSQGISTKSLLIFAGLSILCATSFYLSLLQIYAPDAPIRLVQDPVTRTSLGEMIMHWGLPIFLMASASLILLNSWELRILAAIFILLGLVYTEALPLLVILFLINLLRVGTLLFESPLSHKRLLLETAGIAAIGLIITPEIIYLDDVYGTPNERMNTIFKIYSSSWFLFHFFAFFLIREAASSIRWKIKPVILYPVQGVFVFCMLGFFVQTIEIRKVNPEAIERNERGLGTLETFYPGAASVIEKLQNESRSVILEAQGPPYHYTSHVATLSGQTAFLGWANHVRVYLQLHDEVSRREALTTSFYKHASCSEKEALLITEGIDFAVVGPLERQHHPELDIAEFECLKKVFSAGQYSVYSVRAGSEY